RNRVHRFDRGNQVIVDLDDFFEVLLPVRDLDAHVPEYVEDPEQLVGVELDIGQASRDVVGAEESLFFAFNNQGLGGQHHRVFCALQLPAAGRQRLLGRGGVVA